MKKRLLVGILSLTLLSLCACGDKKTDDNTNQSSPVSIEESIQSEPSVSVIEETKETEPSEAEEPVKEAFDETSVESFEVNSTDLKDGVWDTAITNTSNGSNVSPQLSWEEVEGADSYVVYMVDNSANFWLHWISKDVKDTELPQGWADAKEYVGPYPPSGTHEYQIYVIALKQPVSKVYGSFDKGNLMFEDNKYNCDTTDDGQAGNIVAIGTITGTYTAGE